MGPVKDTMHEIEAAPDALQVYLLGTLDFEAMLRFQRRLHYEVSGDRTQAALVLCEHPPLITVGRHGSRAHILLEPEELRTRGWRVRWVNRGGGCWLHQAGQLSVYAVLPLDRLGLTVPAYHQRLGQVMHAWLREFAIPNEWRAGGVWAGSRLLGAVGCAVRDWVSYYGLCLNINPVLDPFRLVRCAPGADLPMTSLERERRGRIRPSMARERLLEQFQAVFGFARISLFTDHPALATDRQRSGIFEPLASDKRRPK